jgi:hypothetical protein
MVIRGLISLLFAAFLIGLGTSFVGDVDRWFPPPAFDRQKSPRTTTVEEQVRDTERTLAGVGREIEDLRKTADVSARALADGADSFRAWLATRGTLQSGQEDDLVRGRTRALDRLRTEHEEWLTRVDAKEREQRELARKLQDRRDLLATLEQEDLQAYQRMLSAYELRQFAIRFGVALPILLAGVFVFVRWRKAKYSPLAWGYVWFALYVFFVGLVPYLPSFGGYLRYAVGAALTAVGGVYAIRQATRFAERKQAELQKSREERARQVSHEAAVAAFRAHTCPSCGMDFTVGAIDGGHPKHCFHCGIGLFGKCACGATTFAFFPYCSGCGASLTPAGATQT